MEGNMETVKQDAGVYAFDFSEMGEKAAEASRLDLSFCDNADKAVAHTKIALRAFKKLHDLMADYNNGGIWGRWLKERGINKDEAARMLRRHDFVFANCENADYLLELSVSRKSLVDEAARPSTPQELKDGVAHGDITTLAEFRDMKAQLLAAQDAAARSDAARGAAVEAAEEAQGKAENLAKLLAAEQKDGADARRQCEQLTRMATSLRATIEKQAQELANRPNVETVVVPEDYVALQNENARMKADLAKYEAHARGVSVQELSECEERFRDQQKTREDEREAWKKVDKLLSAIYLFPTANTAEIKELARCFIKESPYREQAVERANKTIERGLKVLQVLGEALGYGQRLTLVK